jgi:uncharacterized protein
VAIGYSKRLGGKQPQRLAGQLVSDADMCDAIGAVGIERALVYACRHGGRIFDPAVWPNVNLAAHEYNADGNTHDTDGFINHFFEKLLKLKGLMRYSWKVRWSNVICRATTCCCVMINRRCMCESA